jgi:FkbM family methyltransferase
LLQTCSYESYGLSVEPLKCYLDLLPNKPNAKKIHACISDKDGEIDIFYVHPSTINFYSLDFGLKGCNSIGQPHKSAQQYLKDNNLPEKLIQKEKALVKSIKTLFNENNVEGIDFLKIDTEGHDLIIMNNYIDYSIEHKRLWAKKIQFEANVLTIRADQEAVIKRLEQHGYTLISFDTDAVLELTQPT